MHFWWCTLNTECNLWHRKNIPSNHFLEFSLHFISVIKTALSITCRLWSAKLQHRTKNSSDSNSLRDMFSSFCPETISISWSCCLSLPVFILLPVPYICLYQTLACIPMTQEYFAVIWHWWGQMAAYVYLHSIFIVRSRIVDRVEKRVGHKSGLRISLLKVWTCLLLKFRCKSCCERSQRHNWNTICELQAGNWCRILNGVLFKSKLHTCWVHITFDIRERWPTFL